MISWQLGTVREVRRETSDVKTFVLEPEEWRSFRAGQYIDVRLTAPDGYQAQRSYSIASAPEQDDSIEITVELLEDGEVSPYFHHVIEPGDQIEFRGPIGGPFTWSRSSGRRQRLLLVAGGSGIVPIMSILRHRIASGVANGVPAVLIFSNRSADRIIYGDELSDMDDGDNLLEVTHTLTRSRPTDWGGFDRRVDAEMVGDAIGRLTTLSSSTASDADIATMCYVCGPTDFVESVAQYAVEGGIPASDVRTERFGPTGT